MQSRIFLTAVACSLAALPGLRALAEGLPRARAESVGMSSARLDRLTDVTHDWVDQGHIAGVVTLVARRGSVVHLNAYGMADIENNEPMRENAYFRLYSMTKPVTTVALLMQYEQGKFRLSDPLARHLPEYADVKVFAGTDANGTIILDEPVRAPTMHDVFRHTPGFGNLPEAVRNLIAADTSAAANLDEYSQTVAASPLLYQPGERWVYSHSHDIQARLVEVFSGLPFDQYVHRYILEPLGMEETVFGLPANLRDRFPNTYNPGPSGEFIAMDTPEDTSYDTIPRGGTSLSGTIMDYALFAQMLVNSGELNDERLLSPVTIDLMSSDHLPAGVARGLPGGGEALGESYGLGVRVVTDSALAGNLTSAGTFGWSGAAGTHFFVDRSEDLIAVFMIQRLGTGPGNGDLSTYDMRPAFETLVYQAIIE